MNPAVPGVGSVGGEPTLTVQALQQALLGVAATPMPHAAEPPAVNDAPPVATPPGDAAVEALSDTPAALAALVMRGAHARHSAVADAAERAAPAAASRPDASAPAAAQAQTPAWAGDRPATHALAALPLVATLLTPLVAARAEMRQATPARLRREGEREDDTARHGQGEPPPNDDEDTVGAVGPALRALGHEADAVTTVPPWCAPLLQSLRLHATDPAAARVLHHALTQWQRGHTVLLACPQAVHSGELGWLYALQVQAAGHAAHLLGQRFEARLSWRTQRRGAGWWGVRTVKEQSLHGGRQLRSQAGLVGRPNVATGGFDLALQLGRNSTGAAPARVLDIRVDAVARLWALVDRQWGVLLLASDCPLPERHEGAGR